MTDALTRTDPAGLSDGDALRELAGIPADGHVDRLRALRPAARDNAQLAYQLLFRPEDATEVSVVERLAVATFVAELHLDDRAGAHYRTALLDAGGSEPLARALADEAAAAVFAGPVGTYREPGLAAESVQAPEYRAAAREVVGVRLAAALEHARLLVLHPRDARPERLEALTAAGWSTTGIVTLSQLVAYLSYQLRAATGLAVLHATPGGTR